MAQIFVLNCTADIFCNKIGFFFNKSKQSQIVILQKKTLLQRYQFLFFKYKVKSLPITFYLIKKKQKQIYAEYKDNIHRTDFLQIYRFTLFTKKDRFFLFWKSLLNLLLFFFLLLFMFVGVGVVEVYLVLRVAAVLIFFFFGL